MAIRENSSDDGFRGRQGNTVTYKLKNKIVRREIGVSTKPPTEKQLAVRQCTAITSALLQPVKEFIEVGFELQAALDFVNQHNSASSYNRKNAISGIYPDQHIDFTKVLFSKGKLPNPLDARVKLSVSGLEFSWNIDLNVKGVKWNDQVMLMAYFPERQDAVYLINGARRNKGTDELPIPQFKSPVIMETYISFVSANHKSISDSMYTGQIMWPGII